MEILSIASNQSFSLLTYNFRFCDRRRAFQLVRGVWSYMSCYRPSEEQINFFEALLFGLLEHEKYGGERYQGVPRHKDEVELPLQMLQANWCDL